MAAALAPALIHAEAQEPDPKPQDPTEAVSYTGDIRPIVVNFCATCHHGDDPDGGFVLDDYDDVREHTEDGDLLERINDDADPMPPAGLMPERQRELFKQWAAGGYKYEGKGTGSDEVVPFEPPPIEPVSVDDGAFKLLERVQGHWVGSMNLMGRDMDWFAWDYRAIAPSHVHAIFEGGTLGNLFNSLFVSDFRGTRTVMARNGGVLNGIYRTSYFVLDRIQEKGKATSYRLVDAYGGPGIMWMELTFEGDDLTFVAHTSRLGMAGPPRQHMRFKGSRMHPELAKAQAKEVGFPEVRAEASFPKGLELPFWGKGIPITSYSYIWEDKRLSVKELGKIARDPIRIDQMPHLAQLELSIERGVDHNLTPLGVYLSREPLTDAKGKLRMKWGYPDEDVFNGILMFSDLTAGENVFTFTYLHPGTYYLTVVADVNRDGYPSKGDVTHASVRVEVAPEHTTKVQVPGLTVQN